MPDPSSAYRKHKLGSTHARPRVIAHYTADTGWRHLQRPYQKLTDKHAADLKVAGLQVVRVRRFFREVDIQFSRYLPPVPRS
ncbi:hypothetical protein ABMA10_00120 [Plantibacter sp. RU18]